MILPGRRAIAGFMEEEERHVPVIALSCDSVREAQETASLVLMYQNGSRPFSSGPAVYVGDTRIRVSVVRSQSCYYVEVDLRADPAHLTSALYLMSAVPETTLETFLKLFELCRHYVFTVAVGETLALEMLDLVKYVIYRRNF